MKRSHEAPFEPPTLGSCLAELLPRSLQGDARELLAATITLVADERDRGNVCIALGDHAQRPREAGAPFPAVAAWRDGLLASGLCATGETGEVPTPLVLRPDGRLYFHRHWATERRLVAALRARLDTAPLVTPEALRAALQTTGWRASTDAAPDWQLAAIATIAARPFTILCGGPGTGKTTTVARAIAVLRRLHPQLHVALAAPTGKAAARLGEALRAQRAALGATDAERADPEPTTLHRLLGYLALDDAFRRGADRPLPHDLVVVDEASMVDPALLAQLFAALRPTARLLLVGDKDQLAAIAAGQVLGELCRSAAPERGVGSGLAEFVRIATGMVLPVQPNAHPMAECTVLLRKNHRFGAQPGIGAFASALATRRPDDALTALEAGHDDLVRRTDPERALATIADALLDAASAPDPETALRRLSTVRILAASRHGPHGTIAWNERVESLLRERGRRAEGPYYPGRPILVVANDHQNRVWNGDLGVIHPDDKGRPFAWFPTVDGQPRRIAPVRLPPHETAWAITVHKAQGSEFETVLVSMPDQHGPMWNASLLYTAVTRARRRAVVLADPTLLPAALANWPERTSGLAIELARTGRSPA